MYTTTAAAQAGAVRLFLEVAEDNAAARALYDRPRRRPGRQRQGGIPSYGRSHRSLYRSSPFAGSGSLRMLHSCQEPSYKRTRGKPACRNTTYVCAALIPDLQ